MKYFTVVLAIGVLLPCASAARPPPPRNPHQLRNTMVAHPTIDDDDREPATDAASVIALPSSRAPCDKAGLISATGDALVKKVKESDSQCINQLFSVTGNDAKLAFNYNDMMSVVYSFYSATAVYDANNPAKDSLLQLVLFLRAGFYVNSYNPQDTGSYGPDLYNYVEYGLKALFGRPNMDARNYVHYDTFGESVTLVINAKLSLKLIDDCATLMTKITSWSSWTLQDSMQGTVVNNILTVYWRLTWESGANEQLNNKMNVPTSADNFLNVRANLLNTAGEWVLNNAGSELARFMQFASIKSRVSPMVQKQIKKYSMSYGPKMYVNMASMIDQYDAANCAYYGTCGWKESAKSSILSITRTCAITYVDQFTIKAQKITSAQLDEVCNRLKSHESYFHNKVITGWKPVKDDNNWRLNVVIYASGDDYKAYNYALYGYDTNNGGIYIEGNPADKNNIGQFFCYVQYSGSKWDVWNLEHEITHYFDGRYDTWGDFALMYKYPTVWWSEGLGEYMAHKDNYHSVQQVCTDLKYSLSSVFATVYDDGTEKVYYYGYAASRFMFERHRPVVDQILSYMRDGKFDQYKSYMQNTIGKLYDSEFVSWCRCIAAGKPC